MRIGVFVGSSAMLFDGVQLDPSPTVQSLIGGGSMDGLYASCPWGMPSDDLQVYAYGEHQLFVLRRHGAQHQYAPHAINYRANIWLMAQLQLDGVVATNTVGGIAPDLAVGGLVVPDQIIDYSWGRPSTYDDEVRHIEFTFPYDNNLRQKLLTADESVLDGGVYGCTQGPRLETAAEIQRLHRDGCTLVGMTGMPEAALARELSVPYASLCLVVNPAAGLSEQPIDLQALSQASQLGAAKMVNVLEKMLVSS